MILQMLHLVNEFVNEEDPIDASIKQGTADLCACYACLSDSAPFAGVRLAKHSGRFTKRGSTFTSSQDSICSRRYVRNPHQGAPLQHGHTGTRSLAAT